MTHNLNKNTQWLAAGILLLCLLFSNSSSALKNVQPPSYHVIANRARYDRDKHQATFTGNAIATHADSKLTGNRIVLYLDKANRQIIQLIAYGKPATYITQKNKNQQRINARADIITYYPTKNLVTFAQHANVKQDRSSITGRFITYNIKTQIMESNEHQQHQRTTIIITKQNLVS